MVIDILKNPVIIALLAGILTYLYIWWSNEKKYKKNPESKKMGVITPFIVTVVVWILAYGYNEMCDNTVPQEVVTLSNVNGIADINNLGLGDIKYKLAKADIPAISSESARSFHLISKGVNIPNNLKLPDVFIETL
jgi:hypothetical protein